ncbi:MAG: efflux RND transporter periplasmic adaptor subunit [Verrucomicrobiales bacterium]
MRRFIQFFLLVAAIAGAAFYVVRGLRPPVENPDARLRVAAVTVEDLVREVRIVGTVTPVVLTEIKSEIGGRVETVRVENGQEVKKGDLLIELDRRELTAEIEELKRSMVSVRLLAEKATRDHEREKGLREKDFSTEQELLDAATEMALRENELSIQEARLATLEEKLAKTRLMAPHDGVVLNLDLTPGRVLVGANSFSKGDVPMEVADLSRLRIEAKVNEVDLAVLRLKQKAKVTFASIPGLEAEAEVVNISPSAEKRDPNQRGWGQPESVLFPVRLYFSAPDERVRPGISALATITAERVREATVAPVAAVFRSNNESFVFRRSKAGAWEKVGVELGLTSRDKIQVRGGLGKDDEVALGLPQEFDPRANPTNAPAKP